jgi:hypothetical protein
VGTNLLLIFITKFNVCVFKFLTSNDLNYSESGGRSVVHDYKAKGSIPASTGSGKEKILHLKLYQLLHFL